VKEKNNKTIRFSTREKVKFEDSQSVIHALWIGPRLRTIEQECLKSFVRNGHPVVLHCYENVENVPQGISISDASIILPKNEIFKHLETDSYAIFSDLFRYELMAVVDGIYVDCDMFCLKPIELSNYVMGYQSPELINNAVLRVPKNSALLSDLRSLRVSANERWPWEKQKLASWWQRHLERKTGRNAIAYKPWGSSGPLALTYFVQKHGLEKNVKDQDVFYPVHYSDVHKLFDPAHSIEEMITKRTVAIHLYNEVIRTSALKSGPIPPLSPLGKLFDMRA
jgi:Alpha 1,4-glycosyltransferase conserved region/Glycosyltransferase sugar-binding region containing DXD motif